MVRYAIKMFITFQATSKNCLVLGLGAMDCIFIMRIKRCIRLRFTL